MKDLFFHILSISVTAGIVALAVCVLRLFLKKAPKWISVLLWGLVAIRLIVPFSFESRISVIPDVSFPSYTESVSSPSGSVHDPATETPPIEEIGNGSTDAHDPIVIGDEAPVTSSTAVVASPSTDVTFLDIAPILWLAGVGVMILYAAGSYLSMRRRVRTATRLDGNVYQCETVASPFILGIVRPKIYLPYTLAEEHFDSVLAHERAHIQRLDHIIKPLGFLLLSVYWFQPLLWVAYLLLCRDIEMACDEKAVKEMSDGERRVYSMALVTSAVGRRRIAACPLAFGEVAVSSRIKSVMHYKKPTLWIVIAAVVLSVAASVCLLTDPIVGDAPVTFDGGELYVRYNHSASERIDLTGSDEPGGAVKDRVAGMVYFDIEELNTDDMTVTVKTNVPLSVDGVESHTIVIPFDKTVVAVWHGDHGGESTFELTVMLPETGNEPWLNDDTTAKTVRRFTDGEVTLFLYRDYFRLTETDQPLYTSYEGDTDIRLVYNTDEKFTIASTEMYKFENGIVEGVYEWTDDTLILTENGGLTQYVFDIADDGKTLIHRKRDLLRHEKAHSPILKNRLKLTCEYICTMEKDDRNCRFTITNGDGECAVTGQTEIWGLTLTSLGDGRLRVTTNQLNDEPQIQTHQLLDVENGEWLGVCGQTSSSLNRYELFVIEEDGKVLLRADPLISCGNDNTPSFDIELSGVSSLETANLRGVLDGTDCVAIYRDDDGNTRVIARTFQDDQTVPLDRTLVVTTGEPLSDYHGLNPTTGTVDMLVTADGNHVYYDRIAAAFIRLDGVYVELLEALGNGQLTVAQLRNLVDADVASGAATVIPNPPVGELEQANGGYSVSYVGGDMSHIITFVNNGIIVG